MQRESADWIVFHTNLSGDALREARERFVAGEDLGPYLNAGDELVGPENTRKLKYFGHPEASLIKRLRIAFGASLAGRVARRLRGRKLPPREGEADPPTVHELTSAHRSPLDDLALVVWVDDPASLASGLSALYAALGARPRQVVALVSTQDAAVDVAWGAHLDGHTDKLVVSRSLAPRSGPSLASMTDHGVFAHAHCPNYLLARASSLASRAGMDRAGRAGGRRQGAGVAGGRIARPRRGRAATPPGPVGRDRGAQPRDRRAGRGGFRESRPPLEVQARLGAA